MNAVARAQLRLEERADARLEQHRFAAEVPREHAAAGELDAVLVVRRSPALPERARHVAEHRAAVEALTIALNRPESHPGASSSAPLRRTAAPRAAHTAGCSASSCCVAAARDDAAVSHHDDAVGFQHGREPVRDDDRRAVLHEPLERLLHEQLVVRVERARRLVEQQDRRVLENRARDRDALPLSARQPHAALAEKRVVPLRQHADELVGAGRARRRLDLGVGGARAGRSGCSRAPLAPNSTVSCGTSPIIARTSSGSRARDVDAVDEHAARGRIVEPQQQLKRRALAGTRRPDERDRLAGLDRRP